MRSAATIRCWRTSAISSNRSGRKSASTSSNTIPRKIRSRACSAPLVYQRAKNVLDKRPFGTQLDVYGEDYEWLNHSLMPAVLKSHDFRITIGEGRAKPYSASVFNISAMSFGALSANAIRALNLLGAQARPFLSRHRRRFDFALSPRNGRRPGLGNRLRLFRLPRRRRRLQRGKIHRQRLHRPGEDDRGETLAGRQAWPWRRAAGSEGFARNRRRARRADWGGLRFAVAALGVFHADRTAAVRRPPAQPLGRQADRIQAGHRSSPGNGSASPRRWWKPVSVRTSSSSMAARAAPARLRWNSPITSVHRCARRCCWCTTPW